MIGRHIIAAACAFALAGCSSFKLGAVLYCPHGEACSLQKFPAPQPDKEKPLAPA